VCVCVICVCVCMCARERDREGDYKTRLVSKFSSVFYERNGFWSCIITFTIYIYNAYLHSCRHTDIHICIFVCACVYTLCPHVRLVCVHVCMYVCMNVCRYVYMYLWIYFVCCMNVCRYVCTCVCMYFCVPTYI